MSNFAGPRIVVVGPRPLVRAFFHWKFSGVFIPLFWGTGLALMLYHNEPIYTYAALCLAGIWSIGFWLTSDALEKMRKRLSGKRAPRGDDLSLKLRQYFLSKWGCALLISVITGVLVLWAHATQLQYEREDAYDKLELTIFDANPADLLSAQMVMKNDSGSRLIGISHVCIIRAVLLSTGDIYPPAKLDVGFDQGTGQKNTLAAHGDAETIECLGMLRHAIAAPSGTTVQCVDLTLEGGYSLEDQPAKYAWKRMRYMRRYDWQTWAQESVEGSGDTCSPLARPQSELMSHFRVILNPEQAKPSSFTQLLFGQLASRILHAPHLAF